jgi:hypothetical protein
LFSCVLVTFASAASDLPGAAFSVPAGAVGVAAAFSAAAGGAGDFDVFDVAGRGLTGACGLSAARASTETPSDNAASTNATRSGRRGLGRFWGRADKGGGWQLIVVRAAATTAVIEPGY